MSSVTVEQYTEKSIVVRGDTIPYKNKLLSLGGKWNKMLRGGEGWIFPLTKKSLVEQALSEPPTSDVSAEKTLTEQVKRREAIPRQQTGLLCPQGSSEIILTKKEYLHLISRIEKTEQLILRVDRLEKLLNINEKQIDTSNTSNMSISNKLPLLSNINENDLADYGEEEEEERKVQPLLRKKKIVN
jgi:hypothetical protein